MTDGARRVSSRLVLGIYEGGESNATGLKTPLVSLVERRTDTLFTPNLGRYWISHVIKDMTGFAAGRIFDYTSSLVHTRRSLL